VSSGLYGFGDKIGDWTQTVLVKFIRDLFQNQPPDFLPLLKAEEIQVTRKITLGESIVMIREPSFRKIGGTGQPAFANSWVNFGSNWADAAFWRDPFGIVHLRGLIKSGTVGSAAFTLPPGFRPAVSETFGTISNGAVGRVDVLTNGTVTPATPSNNTYVSLSGITFRTT
jgi:hypothetical protein